MLAPERVLIEEVDRLRAQELADHLGLSPVLGQLLLQRGLHDVTQAEAFLSDGVEAFHDPLQMRDMARAVSLLWSAIQDGLTIFIHGDYDVDGISSTVLLVEALTELGAKVEHHVPDRFTEGYGVSIAAVQAAAERGCRVLLTVDCGSSSVEAALDSYNGENGVLAFAVKQGLTGQAASPDGRIDALQLGVYARRTVPELAAEKNHRQSAVFKAAGGDLKEFPITTVSKSGG